MSLDILGCVVFVIGGLCGIGVVIVVDLYV